MYNGNGSCLITVSSFVILLNILHTGVKVELYIDIFYDVAFVYNGQFTSSNKPCLCDIDTRLLNVSILEIL